jgi:hypothetical protein
MLSAEISNTNFVVFGLARLWLETTIYSTGGEYTNHYTTQPMHRHLFHSKNICPLLFLTNYIVTLPRYFSFRLPHLNIPTGPPSDELDKNILEVVVSVSMTEK